MKAARGVAVVTWVNTACFGVPAIPVSIYLLSQGRLPSFLGLFDVYGGPWSARFEPGTFVVLLAAFLGVAGLAAWSARWLWQGHKVGAVVNLGMLPVEAIFWLGFALPLPWLVGAARVVLLAIAWPSLAGGRRPGAPSEATARTPLAGA